jgi:hypothetical protein
VAAGVTAGSGSGDEGDDGEVAAQAAVQEARLKALESLGK